MAQEKSAYEVSAQDSPIAWVRQHISRYVETDGRDGHYLQGLPTLVLTTTGRRSGVPRRTGATYGRRGGDYIVIASDGGSPVHPQWYLNLLADPRVEVQVGADRFAANARVAAGEERRRLWHDMVALSPLFAELQARTAREFPIIVIHPDARA
jgi:deazaflavin-dependent oxidoreductase (nitroreductase family)